MFLDGQFGFPESCQEQISVSARSVHPGEARACVHRLHRMSTPGNTLRPGRLRQPPSPPGGLMASGMKWWQSMHSLRGGPGGGRHVCAHARSAAVTHHCCVESWHTAIGKGPPLAGRGGSIRPRCAQPDAQVRHGPGTHSREWCGAFRRRERSGQAQSTAGRGRASPR